MRLDSVAIEGYKRFETQSVLRTRGKASCLVGPNEAGKTSLLEALSGLFVAGWPGAYVFSSRQQPDDDKVIVSARYRLEDDDFQVGDDLLADRKVSGVLREADMYVEIRKLGSGASNSWLVNAPARDLEDRHRLAVRVGTAVASTWFGRIAVDATSVHAELRPLLEALGDDLTSEENDLPQAVVERLRLVVDGLDRVESENSVKLADGLRAEMLAIRDEIDEVYKEESQPRPGQVLVGPLIARCPRFLLFDAANRELPGFQPHNATPGAAFLNLLHLAEVDLAEIRSAATAGNRPRLATLQLRANHALGQALAMWSQEAVSVNLDISVDGVEVQILEESLAELTPLEERSAGLRTYVALLAFLNAERADATPPPILLIDEAELHLHYDAQANLIEALHRQDITQHVIYSTHSVGCLPEDLGMAVRAIEPVSAGRSVIRQTAWVDGFGLSPLLARMGAATFAFLAARSALFVEGMVDALMLPRLFRESLDDNRLVMGFQVVPGLSEVPKKLAESLDAEAGTVLYLSDDDEGGRRHRRKIPQTAKDGGRVFVLGGGSQAGMCLEDLLREEVLVDAMRRIALQRGVPIAADELDVPEIGRAAWIDENFKDRGLGTTRTVLAYAVLEQDQPVLAERHKDLVARLFAQVRASIPK